MYRYDPVCSEKNKPYKSGRYRCTKKSGRIYTGILVVEAGVVSACYLLTACLFKKCGIFVIFLKGQMGLKVLNGRAVGCLGGLVGKVADSWFRLRS